jgi:hypothetical protein
VRGQKTLLNVNEPVLQSRLENQSGGLGAGLGRLVARDLVDFFDQACGLLDPFGNDVDLAPNKEEDQRKKEEINRPDHFYDFHEDFRRESGKTFLCA